MKKRAKVKKDSKFNKYTLLIVIVIKRSFHTLKSAFTNCKFKHL